jgi:hypothetical protein
LSRPQSGTVFLFKVGGVGVFDIDWSRSQDALHEKTTSALRTFAREHPEEEVSFFAYRADYCYGQVFLCLDTPRNARRRVKENHERIRATRKRLFDRPGGWDGARYFATRHSDRVIDYTYATGLFQFDAFAEVRFSDWEEYFRSEQYSEADQFENRVIVLFWKVLEQVAEDGVLREMRLASPFRTGFEFHDSDLGLLVIQILNWPDRE